MDRIYSDQAMEIIHWMAKVTDGMDLFANSDNKNPEYEKRRPSFRDQCRMRKSSEDNESPKEDLSVVDVSVIPKKTIEVNIHCIFYISFFIYLVLKSQHLLSIVNNDD